ncbi:MAG: sigma-70 family RNA polymerase sigma factor [Planctomycetota bacterium]|nr:sigma-70 family RNA polymerase sigma factor [Planctomycetota bacterium]
MSCIEGAVNPVNRRRPAPPPLDDLALIEGLRSRREAAVTAFLERYKSLLHHCIGHFESDAVAREDRYQDIVLYVLERLDRDAFNPDRGSFGTWLYRVAWCRCVDLKRRDNAGGRPRMKSAGEEIPDRADESPGPSEIAGTSEVGGVVREALDELSTEERSLLDLRFVQGETLGEIARRQAISLEQTKYRLRRATISLRRVLVHNFAHEEALTEI